MDPALSSFLKFRFLIAPEERRQAGVLLGLMVIGMGLETLCAGLIVPVIAVMTREDVLAADARLASLSAWLGNPTHPQLVLYAMLALAGIYAVKNLYLAFLAWRLARFTYGSQARMAQRLFTSYLRQPYTFHLQRNPAQLISNATREVAVYSDALFAALCLVAELLVLGGISILLLAVEPLGALVGAALLAGASLAFYRATRGRSLRWGEERQRHEALRMQSLQQGLGGAKDLKLLGREEEFLAQFGAHNQESARVARLQGTLVQLPRLWIELLAILALATLVAIMVAQGKGVASIAPTLGLFAAAAFRLAPSVNRLLTGMQTLRYSAPAVDVLYRELQLGAPAPQPRRGAPSVVRFSNEIALAEVGFIYPDAAAPAVSAVSLRIGKGESVGFIGASGAGKSTLVDLLLGLLAPTTGKVLVDGRDIREDLRAWQDQIGYVPQSIYLTDDSVRRNVAFGIPEHQIDDAAVARALRAAQLDEFVAALPHGVETLVGDRGARLSGGQRQRIGIARALYHDPAVLVLDEASSALDAETERAVMQAVAALHGSKTILIIAHRASAVAGCDRLYRLEGGRVAAERAGAGVLAA